MAERRPEEALQLARESREILAAGLPPDHWLLAAATSVEGAALVRLRRYTEAEPLLIASLGPLEGSPIADLPQRARAWIVELYSAWGKPELAAKYLKN